MFLAPVRVLEVSPPRPRKKERRIASHRVSPPTSRLLLFPAPPLPALDDLASFCVVHRGWNRRENINFSVPRLTYASFPLLLLLLLPFRDPSHPWDFLGHGSVIWCPTDDRSLTLPFLPQPRGRSLGSSIMVLSAPLGPAHAENTATLLFSGRTICPPVRIEKL